MMQFRRMSMRLLNAYRKEVVNLYFAEILSMSPSEKDDIQKLRSSPICGVMEYVDENGSVTVLRLRTISGPLLGERVLCNLKQRGTDERYLIFSRYAPLILNCGNIHSRTAQLLPIEGDPNKFIPEHVIFDNSLIVTSLDGERILVVSSQDRALLLAGDLALSRHTHTLEKSIAPFCYARSTYREQPKEVLVVRTDTYSHGLDALTQYLPFLGTWTWTSPLER